MKLRYSDSPHLSAHHLMLGQNSIFLYEENSSLIFYFINKIKSAIFIKLINLYK